jgi:hypothetical protein
LTTVFTVLIIALFLFVVLATDLGYAILHDNIIHDLRWISMNHGLLAFDVVVVGTPEKAGIGEGLRLKLLGTLASLSSRVCQAGRTAIIVRVSLLVVNLRVLIGCCGALKHSWLFSVLF